MATLLSLVYADEVGVLNEKKCKKGGSEDPGFTPNLEYMGSQISSIIHREPRINLWIFHKDKML